ncbi:Efflux pump ustT [Hyphodiscus hymeniophilus]|uniref:Efflux pump ustT n=1 Tax=Hyphodiscus hymeniophilus TaxID=353542 RepID=A0A9P6VF43_9HELO|nr:Efflux pump ustT [Hyphodiscus hymeniophilus]
MAASEYPFEDDRSQEEQQEQPLLPNGSLHRTKSRSHASIIHKAQSPRAIIAILFTILFILASGGYLLAVPGLRLYENIICHHYYYGLDGEGHIGLDGDIDESLCKVDELNEGLSIINDGAIWTTGRQVRALSGFQAISNLLRIGRKIVFTLALSGLILSGLWSIVVLWFWKVLPIRLVWLCPMFLFIGGGQAVAGMMFFAIGSDVTTESDRSNIFLLGKVAGVVAELIAPTVASFLMAKSPWIPFTMGIGLLMFGTSLIILIPETGHRRSTEDIVPESSSEHSSGDQKNFGFFTTTKFQILDGFKRIYEASIVLHSLPILFLLLTFLTEPVGSQSMDLSLRYVSKRFSWALRNTGFLLSLTGFVKIVLLLGILPGLSYYLTERLHFSSKAKDLSLARYSAVMLFIGALIFAVSPTVDVTIIGLVIYTLGVGFCSLTRSLITTFVDKQHVARLYAAIAVVEVVTTLAAGPSLAALYSVGLKMKGAWLALPFYVLALVCFLGGLGVWCFGFLAPKQEEMPYGDEDRDSIIGNTLFLHDDTAETGLLHRI